MATLISQVKGFVTSQNKAGKLGLAMMERTIDHMFEHKDWTPLAWLIAKSDPKDASIYRSILRVCVGGITLETTSKRAKEREDGMWINMANNAGPTEKMSVLRQLVKDGESFRGAAVSEQLLSKPAPDFDFHRWVANALKRMEREGKTIADLLREVEAINKENSTIDVTEPERKDAAKLEPKKAA